MIATIIKRPRYSTTLFCYVSSYIAVSFLVPATTPFFLEKTETKIVWALTPRLHNNLSFDLRC